MSKYIPAEKLIAEIERQQRRLMVLSNTKQVDVIRDCAIQNGAYDNILTIITSLQQEQPMLDSTTKEQIIDKVKNITTTNACNCMGCSENWYNPYYAIREVFGLETLETMEETELNNLVKLAERLGNALY